MRSRKQLAALATVMAVLFAPVAVVAQTMKVTPSPFLTEGSLAKISYKDARKAGQTVTVVVTSDGVNPVEVSLQITLDATGNGAVTFPVPDWGSATFESVGVTPVTVPIVPSEAPQRLPLQ